MGCATRHPNCWKAGRAHFDEVETLFVSDAVARINALRAGEIDVMNKVDLVQGGDKLGHGGPSALLGHLWTPR